LKKIKRAFVTPELEGTFAGYVRRLLGPALERIGMDRRADEPESASLLRPQLLLWLGRDGGDPAVLAQAAKVTAAYLADPASVDPGVVGVALQLRALSGDRALFDEFKRRLEAATVPADRERFLAAGGFFAEGPHTAPGIEKEMAKVAEAVKDCAALRSREGGAVAAYLGRP